MSALTRNTSGRVVLVALGIALIGAMMAITLFPADAAVVTGSDEGRVNGDACEVLGFPGESFAFDVPKGSANDQTRVFDENYSLEDGASVAVFLPSNRSYMDFDMTGAWVSAVVVFGRNNQGEGTLYNYSGESFVQSDDELTSLSTGNIKSVTLCYDTKVSPSIATVVTPATAAIGDEISDEATLSGGFQATGTITFSVYLDDDSCTDDPKATWDVTVDGDGDYSSPGFTPTARGTYYWVASYLGDDNNHPTSGTCGDVNEISTVFDHLFLCGIPITDANSPEGLNATFVRPEGTEGCNDAGVPDDTPKFGNIDFSATDEVIQFTPGGEGDAVFVGELVFDGGGPYPILQIDDTDDGVDNFVDMEWYVGTAPEFEYDLAGNLIGAEFSCSNTADWCILDGSIDPDGITWIIGGDAVDPRFR